MPRPDETEFAPFYAKYVALVPEEEILPALAAQLEETLAFLRSVPEAETTVCHPPYTWTFKQVIGHLTDGERIFGYRALRFARGDTTPLSGFDENVYAQVADFNRFALADLAAEFAAVRRSHLLFFGRLTDAEWARRGVANDNEVSVRALAYILVGHERHHTGILRQRLSKVLRDTRD
jgi:hypothetical protein